MSSSHPYEPFLHEVAKPSRYLGGEYGEVRKDWERTAIRVALAFPDAYEVGMSHLGFRILYQLLNAQPDILAERVYAPWPDLEERLRARGLPLVSLESHRALGEFDAIGLSLQYELTFTNVLNMLDLSGLPLRAAQRDRRHPLVVAGGPVAMQPEPLAPFVDCFVIGDGEEAFPRLLRRYREWREEGCSRREILVRLARLGGIYCPALYATEVNPLTGHVVVSRPLHEGVPERVERQIVENLNDYPFPAEVPVPVTGTVFDRYSVEIARGCTEGCRFCQAGMIYRPVRERDPEQIVACVLEAVRKGGYDETSLTSLSAADYSAIAPLVMKLMERLKEEKVSLAVSSLRAYGLPEHLLSAITSVRNTGLTFAPEAGTQRLRDVVNKNISEEDMVKAAEAVFSRGWSRCKLYFMIGLPTEEDDDVVGIARTAGLYLDIARRYHRRNVPEITVSVSSHVPKPHTPFQWAAMDGLEEIERKQRLLLASLPDRRIRLKWHDARMSHLEGILARGDRLVADLVEYAFRRGCRFDGWDEHFRFEVWLGGLEELGIDRYRSLRTLPIDARLPWDHIDVGLKPGFLEREYRRALKDRLSPPCGKPLRAKVHHTNLHEAELDRRPLVCFDCGIACDLTRMREERKEYLTRLEALTPPAADPGTASIAAIRRRNERPRTQIVNHRKVRYRLLFAKSGPQAYTSHLDLVRLLPRVFRRAGLPMAYSLGFHPKPIVTFSPALPLGWRSAGELADVTLTALADPSTLAERLDGASPPGLVFLRAVRLGDADLPLPRVLEAADYRVILPLPPEPSLLEERLGVVAGGGEVWLPRSRKSPAEVEISRSILEASLETGGPQAALAFRIRVDASPAARADLLAEWLTGRECRPWQVERTAFWALGGGEPLSPVDLEALRSCGAAV